MDKERRRFKRIKQNFILKLRPKKSAGGESAEARWETVNAENLSGGGALFYYHKKLDAGELLDFQVYFPARKGNINCTGKVIRADNPSGSVIYRVGAEFMDISENEKKLIDKEAKKSRPG